VGATPLFPRASGGAVKLYQPPSDVEGGAAAITKLGKIQGIASRLKNGLASGLRGKTLIHFAAPPGTWTSGKFRPTQNQLPRVTGPYGGWTPPKGWKPSPVITTGTNVPTRHVGPKRPVPKPILTTGTNVPTRHVTPVAKQPKKVVAHHPTAHGIVTGKTGATGTTNAGIGSSTTSAGISSGTTSSAGTYTGDSDTSAQPSEWSTESIIGLLIVAVLLYFIFKAL